MSYEAISPAEWERLESEEHDRIYGESKPFCFSDDRIDPAKVLAYEDYCYKPGCRPDRGHRTRRLFEVMGVPNLHGKRILDVGSGSGQYAVLFAMLGAEVEAFDISPVGVEQGRRFARANGVADRCHFDVRNASDMGYASDTFDIVVFHEVLHHAIKYPNVREETLRVLKPGGMAVCAESLRGNILLDLARKVTMHGGEAKGDVILDLPDLDAFAQGFSSHTVETMSLLFMAKRVVQPYVGVGAVRVLLRGLKSIDDVLLRAFPGLGRYCGECVAVYQK